jgi:error-prone DNA polymerase
VLVGDARRHGIAVWPVDLERSRGKCTVEEGNIRLGFNYVTGFGEAHINLLEQARQANPFASLKDFCRRTRLPRRLVENLIVAGAMDAWGRRRKLLWTLGQLDYREAALNLDWPDDGVELPSLSQAEAMRLEYGVLGLSTGEHIMSQYRTRLTAQGILGSWELESQPNDRHVQVAGLVVVHQSPPTAKGFHFITLEDEAGLIDLIIRPQVYERYRRLLRNEPLLVAAGTIQRQGGVTNLLVKQVMSLSRSKG